MKAGTTPEERREYQRKRSRMNWPILSSLSRETQKLRLRKAGIEWTSRGTTLYIRGEDAMAAGAALL